MDGEVDLILISSMIGRAIEDLVYRQLEDLQKQGRISEEGLAWLQNVSSITDDNGNPKQPLNFDRINQDIDVLISLKQQLDEQLGLDARDNNQDI